MTLCDEDGEEEEAAGPEGGAVVLTMNVIKAPTFGTRPSPGACALHPHEEDQTVFYSQFLY